MKDSSIIDLARDESPLSASAHLRRKPFGFTKMIGGLTILMSALLPFGVVPRIQQQAELLQRHAQSPQRIPSVSVVAAHLAQAHRDISLPGTVQAILETAIYARANGFVRSRNVDIGDKVKAHQQLACLETPELDDSLQEAHAQVLTNIAAKAKTEAGREQAKSDLQKLRAELAETKASLIEHKTEEEFALTTFKRYESLGAQGAISFQDVDEKRTRLKSTQASRLAAEEKVAAAQSALESAKAKVNAEEANVQASDANVEAARARSNRAASEKAFQEVTSPFDGVITERNIEQGMLVSSGSDSAKTPLFKLARVDTVKVFVDVPQYAAAQIKAGLPVRVELKELPSKTFIGKVVRTSVALDEKSRTLHTEIHIPNESGLLAPGMYADVHLSVERNQPPLLVPTNAVVIRDNQAKIIVIEKNKAHYKDVKLGDDLGNEIEVSAGLHPGDKVAVNPSDSIAENTSVIESN